MIKDLGFNDTGRYLGLSTKIRIRYIVSLTFTTINGLCLYFGTLPYLIIFIIFAYNLIINLLINPLIFILWQQQQW